MTGVVITSLPTASTLTGAEYVPVVQSGTTVKTPINSWSYTPAGTGAVTTTVQSKLRETVSVKDFGAVGDGVTDDTAAIQNAVDYCIANGKALYVPEGVYSVGPIDLNGTGHATPANAQWAGLSAMYGDGRFQSIFKARSGLYSGTNYVLTGKNLSGISYRDLGVNGNSVTPYGWNLSWVGGAPIEAPSNQNVLQNVFAEGCSSIAFNLDQFHDSKISGLWCRDTTAGNTAVSLQGAGGQLVMSDSWISSGKIDIACQNAGFSNCGFFGGIELTGSGYNIVTFSGCHVYPNTSNGRLITSSAIGNATRGVTFNGCYFNDATYAVGGRYWNGMIFNACQFNTMSSGFFDSGYWTAAAGSGNPPVFTFNSCSFLSAEPTTSAGAWVVRHNGSRVSGGQTYSDYGDFYSTGTFNLTSTKQTFNAAAIVSAKNVSLANSGTITLPFGAGVSVLNVYSYDPLGASTRTGTTYQVETFQGNAFAATSLATHNGSGGGSAFTVTYDSVNYNIVITNTSGGTRAVFAALSGIVAI